MINSRSVLRVSISASGLASCQISRAANAVATVVGMIVPVAPAIPTSALPLPVRVSLTTARIFRSTSPVTWRISKAPREFVSVTVHVVFMDARFPVSIPE